jgi:hypothetical protein
MAESRRRSRCCLDYALTRQGIDAAVPAFWPGGAIPRRQYHHISRIPLRDYSQSRLLPLRGGRSLDFYDCQKGDPTRHILVTPALEALYLATKLISPAEQLLLKRIGRLYRWNCWYDYKGRTPQEIFSRDASGVGFSHDAEKANNGKETGARGARPDLKGVERLHEARLKRGLESDIRHAPQGGTVKISRPAPAIRHAELKQDMTGYNDGHGSYWNNSNIRVLKTGENVELARLAGLKTEDIYPKRFDRKSINIPKPDLLEAFAKLKKSHSWPLETEYGYHDNARRPVHRDHIGHEPRRRGTSG